MIVDDLKPLSLSLWEFAKTLSAFSHSWKRQRALASTQTYNTISHEMGIKEKDDPAPFGTRKDHHTGLGSFIEVPSKMYRKDVLDAHMESDHHNAAFQTHATRLKVRFNVMI